MSDRETYFVVAPKSGSLEWHQYPLTRFDWDDVDIPTTHFDIPDPETRQRVNDQFEAHFNRSKAASAKLDAQVRTMTEKDATQMQMRLYQLTEPFREVGQGTQIVRLKIMRNGKIKNWNGRFHYVGQGTYSVQSQSKSMPERTFHWKNVVSGPEWNPQIKMWTITINKE